MTSTISTTTSTSATTAADAPVTSTRFPLRSLRVVAADIRLTHSVFALPFALLASFMAAASIEGRGVDTINWPRFAGQLGLIIAAMVFARTAAMLANRLIDRRIDARNPRTAGRALPAGRISVSRAAAFLAGSAVLFCLVCLGFGVLFGNWWPAYFGLPVLAWICAYAWLKRFTWLSHLYLGSSLALSPIAAAAAIDPASLAQPAIWLLAAMVLVWVAGFDIIYALQDVEVDREQGLFSVPARFGVGRAMLICRVLHAAAVGILVAALLLDPRLDVLFGAGVAIVIVLLLYEHATVARWGRTRIALAFFTLNGLISCILGILGIADVLI